MRVLIGVYYQLHSNGADNLKTFETNEIFLNLNPNEIYDKITSVL